MNKTLISIGDELLDLFPNTIVAQTLKRINIGDLTTRSVNYTNIFKIPFTPNNHRIYQHANKVQSSTNLPYEKQSAKITQNGIEVIQNGIHNIKRAKDFYESYILYNSAGFFEELGEKVLTDLDFEGLNGSWNGADIASYRNNSTGIVAPVMDYGFFIPGTPALNVSSYFPSVFYHTIINKIFEEAGYSKSGDVFSDPKYLKKIVAFSRDEFRYNRKFVNDRYASAKVSVSQSIPTPGAGVTVNFSEVVIQDPKGYWDGTNSYTVVETDANASGKYLFALDLLVTVDITVAGGTVDIVVDDSDAGPIIVIPNVGTGVYTINSKDHTLSDFAIIVKESESLTIKIVENSGAPSVTVNAGSIVFNPLDYVGTGTGSFAYFGNLLPDMTQKEFIKDFFVTFGIIPSEIGEVIHCKTLKEIITDKANAKDWTAKRTAVLPELEFNPLAYARSNYFKYSSNGDMFDHDGTDFEINRDLGMGTFTVDNEHATNEKTIYTSPFNNTLTEIYGGIMMARIPINGVAGAFDNAPGLRKLLVRDKYPYEPSVIYQGAPESSYQVAYFESPDEDFTMSFTQFLADWYSEFIDSLQRAKIVTNEYLLTEVDIATLDFTVPIFDTDTYYIINQVKNFIPGQPTEVELLKII
jgi:hypothetical protein